MTNEQKTNNLEDVCVQKTNTLEGVYAHKSKTKTAHFEPDELQATWILKTYPVCTAFGFKFNGKNYLRCCIECRSKNINPDYLNNTFVCKKCNKTVETAARRDK